MSCIYSPEPGALVAAYLRRMERNAPVWDEKMLDHIKRPADQSSTSSKNSESPGSSMQYSNNPEESGESPTVHEK